MTCPRLLPVIRYFMQMIVFKNKNVTKIEKQLLRHFLSLCDWFVDNKLSIHFEQDKTKPILYGTKHKRRNVLCLMVQKLSNMQK